MNQQIWTRERFEQFLQSGAVNVYVKPGRIVLCRCRDLNCHGWRLEPVDESIIDVPRAIEPELELATV